MSSRIPEDCKTIGARRINACQGYVRNLVVNHAYNIDGDELGCFFVETATGPTGPPSSGPFEVCSGDTIRYWSQSIGITAMPGSVLVNFETQPGGPPCVESPLQIGPTGCVELCYTGPLGVTGGCLDVCVQQPLQVGVTGCVEIAPAAFCGAVLQYVSNTWGIHRSPGITEVTIGTTGAFPTVQAALNNGCKFLRVVDSTVTDVNLSVPSADLLVYVDPGAQWTVQGPITFAGGNLVLFGNSSFPSSRVVFDNEVQGVLPSNVIVQDLELDRTGATTRFVDPTVPLFMQNVTVLLNDTGETFLTDTTGALTRTVLRNVILRGDQASRTAIVCHNSASCLDVDRLVLEGGWANVTPLTPIFALDIEAGEVSIHNVLLQSPADLKLSGYINSVRGPAGIYLHANATRLLNANVSIIGTVTPAPQDCELTNVKAADFASTTSQNLLVVEWVVRDLHITGGTTGSVFVFGNADLEGVRIDRDVQFTFQRLTEAAKTVARVTRLTINGTYQERRQAAASNVPTQEHSVLYSDIIVRENAVFSIAPIIGSGDSAIPPKTSIDNIEVLGSLLLGNNASTSVCQWLLNNVHVHQSMSVTANSSNSRVRIENFRIRGLVDINQYEMCRLHNGLIQGNFIETHDISSSTALPKRLVLTGVEIEGSLTSANSAVNRNLTHLLIANCIVSGNVSINRVLYPVIESNEFRGQTLTFGNVMDNTIFANNLIKFGPSATNAPQIIITGSEQPLQDFTFTNNQIWNRSNGNVAVIIGCTVVERMLFAHNTIHSLAQARVNFNAANMVIKELEFRGNTLGWLLFGRATATSQTLQDSIIAGNNFHNGESTGGVIGISADRGNNLTLRGCVFDHNNFANESAALSGGINFSPGTNGTLTGPSSCTAVDCVFTTNRMEASINLSGAVGSTFTGNVMIGTTSAISFGSAGAVRCVFNANVISGGPFAGIVIRSTTAPFPNVQQCNFSGNNLGTLVIGANTTDQLTTTIQNTTFDGNCLNSMVLIAQTNAEDCVISDNHIEENLVIGETDTVGGAVRIPTGLSNSVVEGNKFGSGCNIAGPIDCVSFTGNKVTNGNLQLNTLSNVAPFPQFTTSKSTFTGNNVESGGSVGSVIADSNLTDNLLVGNRFQAPGGTGFGGGDVIASNQTV